MAKYSYKISVPRDFFIKNMLIRTSRFSFFESTSMDSEKNNRKTYFKFNERNGMFHMSLHHAYSKIGLPFISRAHARLVGKIRSVDNETILEGKFKVPYFAMATGIMILSITIPDIIKSDSMHLFWFHVEGPLIGWLWLNFVANISVYIFKSRSKATIRRLESMISSIEKSYINKEE